MLEEKWAEIFITCTEEDYKDDQGVVTCTYEGYKAILQSEIQNYRSTYVQSNIFEPLTPLDRLDALSSLQYAA